MIPRAIAVDALASGQLVSWGVSTALETEVWVLHASQRLMSPKVSAFVTFAGEYFSEDAHRDVLRHG